GYRAGRAREDRHPSPRRHFLEAAGPTSNARVSSVNPRAIGHRPIAFQVASHSGQLGVRTGAAWLGAVAGLALFVFAVVALSGPGRIDIVDGQTRYEVARSLVDHGDPVIRNDQVWFWVFPGRDGQLYTKSRFPQSLVGVATILASDALGPVSEGRRHFYFTLSGAFFCSVLAIFYAVWFRHQGLTPRAAVLWAGAGIFCTPNWFYGTSTFDDILGSTAL